MLNNEGLSDAPTSLPLEQSILCAWYLCPSVSFAYTPPWHTAELRQLEVLGQRLQRLYIKTGLGCSLTNVSRSYSPPKAKSSYYTTQGHQHGEGNTRTLQCWDHLKPPSAATSQSLPFNSKSNTLHEQLVSVNTTQTNLHQPNSLKPWRAVGSALGILLFIIYLHTLGNIFWHYGINFHSYADDTQLYTSTKPTFTIPSGTLTACLQSLWEDIISMLMSFFHVPSYELLWFLFLLIWPLTDILL